MRKSTMRSGLPLAEVLAAAMAGLGFVAGIIYAIGGAIYDIRRGRVSFGTALAFFAVVGMPVMFASFGYILGAIATLIHGRVAQQADTQR